MLRAYQREDAAVRTGIGHHERMLLTKQFPAEHYERAMESWAWLAIADKTPVMSSLFGDLFFVAEDGYWFLDRIEGTLDRQWRNRDDLQSSLARRGPGRVSTWGAR